MRARIPVVVAIIAVGGACALSGCGADSTSAPPLTFSVGECLNDSEVSGQVKEVPRTDCAGPHDSEVYAVFDATGKDSGSMYPDDADLASQADTGCAAHFAEFVGVDTGSSRLSFASYTPLLASWYQDHGREITCVVFDPAGQTSGSLRGAAE